MTLITSTTSDMYKYLNDTALYTIYDISQPTGNIVDMQKNVAAIAYAERKGIARQTAIRIIVEKRNRWLIWLTTTQRRWQRETRNHNKARHHDSIEIREKYVRCHR